MEYLNYLKTKKIGIWGFGIVGKSALKYFSEHGIQTSVMDANELSPQENALINLCKATYLKQEDPNKFFNDHELVLASPGIDLNPFKHYKEKIITELDIFNDNRKNTCIAITGTVGKTTITSILSKILSETHPVITGGNIGTGMLDLVSQQKKDALIVLEVSSFQLEYSTRFAPDLAIITNIYPNHLDRHVNFEKYFEAKYTLIKNQQGNQRALVALDLAHHIIKKYKNNKKNIKNVSFFSLKKPTNVRKIIQNNNFFWIDNEYIIHCDHGIENKLVKIPEHTLIPINLVIIIAALRLLNLSLTVKPELLLPPEHRMEKIVHSNNIIFYNDSKATIMESTLAALDNINNSNVILFLGGLSKGVNRQPYIEKLKNKVKYILCFGKEAAQLHQWAQEEKITAYCFVNLEKSIKYMATIIQPHDIVLFSPGGSSYDLFKNYEERGNKFKELILNEIFNIR